jgi:hemerythrin superfamily protein
MMRSEHETKERMLTNIAKTKNGMIQRKLDKFLKTTAFCELSEEEQRMTKPVTFWL